MKKYIITKIDEIIEKHSLLKHPFYEAWTKGMLDLNALRGYSLEYFHLVKSVPTMAEKIAKFNQNEDILTILNDEQAHIELWRKFAIALGVSAEELEFHLPSDKVKTAINEMLALCENYESGMAAMYAFEADIHRISRSKLEGLAKHFNIIDGDATEYFKVHSFVDLKHSAVWKDLIIELNEDKWELIFNSALSSLSAQNLLLDGVYEKYVASKN